MIEFAHLYVKRLFPTLPSQSANLGLIQNVYFPLKSTKSPVDVYLPMDVRLPMIHSDCIFYLHRSENALLNCSCEIHVFRLSKHLIEEK